MQVIVSKSQSICHEPSPGLRYGKHSINGTLLTALIYFQFALLEWDGSRKGGKGTLE